MRFNYSFTVTFRIIEIHQENGVGKEDIDIEFDISRAESFLFRFYDGSIVLEGYKLRFTYTENHQVSAIYLQDAKDKTIYLVLNPKQVFMEVVKGYRYLTAVDKLTDISEFDFNAAISIQNEEEVEDEFPTIEE